MGKEETGDSFSPPLSCNVVSANPAADAGSRIPASHIGHNGNPAHPSSNRSRRMETPFVKGGAPNSLLLIAVRLSSGIRLGADLMKTGMSTACFYGREYNEDALRRMGELGVHDAELFFSTHGEYAPAFLHEVRRICQDGDVHIRSVHAFGTQFEPQLLSFHDRQFEEAMQVYHEVLAAAQYLGADTYVFHGPMYLKRARGFHPDYVFAGERVSMLADTAAEYGVALCYETVHWCWYHFPEFAPQLLERITSENLYFTLDLKQAAQSGYSPVAYLDLMEGRLRHVHVCDYVKTQEGHIMPCLPMTGQAPWAEIRDKLRDMHFDGYLMLEVYMNDYSSYEELMNSYRTVGRYFS